MQAGDVKLHKRVKKMGAVQQSTLPSHYLKRQFWSNQTLMKQPYMSLKFNIPLIHTSHAIDNMNPYIAHRFSRNPKHHKYGLKSTKSLLC